MPVTQLSYKHWTFEVDIDSTKEWYSGIHLGEAQNCQCNSCRNILLQRDIIPPDIKQLLEKMGVDINKEIHISYWFDDDFDDVFDEESLVFWMKILMYIMCPIIIDASEKLKLTILLPTRYMIMTR